MKDYYKILEVESTATNDQIKSQHRFLVHAWHPDKFPNSEQKVKAEEKLKEINEAYSTLIDPEKKKIHDLLNGINFNNSSENVSGKKYSNNNDYGYQNSYSNDFRNICESCGMPAETKYVKIYQNIGLLVMRKFSSVKGRLCKSCINYHFWTMTGKMMLFGWWGAISFFIAPFLIINNFLRFLSSIKMEKSSRGGVPNPSPFWVFSSLGGVFLIVYLLSFMFGGNTTTSTYAPMRTSTPRVVAQSNLNANSSSSGTVMGSSLIPTKTPIIIPTKRKTPTPAYNSPAYYGCISWSKVTKSMIGKNQCVYGDVYKTRNVGENTFQILFSDNQDAFFLAAGTFYYEVERSDCVIAEGVIQKNTYGVPYIDIDDELLVCPYGW